MTSRIAGRGTGIRQRLPWPAVSAAGRRAVHGFCALCICLLLISPAIPVAHANGTPEAVEHIVVVWLESPGNAEHRQRIITESEVLRDIPGVTGLRAGEVIQSDRGIVDSSFDVALIVSFTDQAAMEDYLFHPVHVKLVEEILKPLVEKILVYDFR